MKGPKRLSSIALASLVLSLHTLGSCTSLLVIVFQEVFCLMCFHVHYCSAFVANRSLSFRSLSSPASALTSSDDGSPICSIAKLLATAP